MERPRPRIFGREGDGHALHGRDQNGVTQCAGEAAALDGHDLKVMAMQVHGV